MSFSKMPRTSRKYISYDRSKPIGGLHTCAIALAGFLSIVTPSHLAAQGLGVSANVGGISADVGVGTGGGLDAGANVSAGSTNASAAASVGSTTSADVNAGLGGATASADTDIGPSSTNADVNVSLGNTASANVDAGLGRNRNDANASLRLGAPPNDATAAVGDTLNGSPSAANPNVGSAGRSANPLAGIIRGGGNQAERAALLFDSLDERDQAQVMGQCERILASPSRNEVGLVQLCQMIAKL